MNGKYTPAERRHVAAVKRLPCSVCDAVDGGNQGHGPGSDAHHPDQGKHWLVIALCWDCHQGPQGWHGTRRRWVLRKFFTELDALFVTLERLAANSEVGSPLHPRTE